MSYVPTKGSPAPSLPSPNAAEQLLAKVEMYVQQAPLSAGYLAILNDIMGGINTVLQAIDPDGQKASQREAILYSALAQGDAGIPALVAFATDKPAHPTAYVDWARWACVQLGAPDPLPGGP
jgi:hypothetical protein